MTDNQIWIVNDDYDDRELIQNIMDDLEVDNELVFFHGAKDLLQRLESQEAGPFIIMCDVNLPGTDGFALREQLLKSADRKFHSVPFIFWSTYASDEQIEKAYRMRAHGFFIKEGQYSEWKQSFAA